MQQAQPTAESDARSSSATNLPADVPPLPAKALAPRHDRRGWWIDVSAACVLAVAAGVAAWCGSRGLDEPLGLRLRSDVWFEADCPRVLENLTLLDSVQARSGVHPLFTFWLYPAVTLARWTFGLTPLLAVRAVRALTAAACMATFFALLRTAGCRRVDSVAFSALAGVSAGAMFWFVVPETYPPGLLAILLTLELAALSERRRPGAVWDVLANLAALSFTITNWMVALASTLARWPWRRALLIAGLSVCLLQCLMVFQNQVFPSASVWPNPLRETEYVLVPEAGGPGRVALAFVFHSMVMPDIGVTERYGPKAGPIMTVQHSSPGSARGWGLAAVIAWSALLALGIWALLTYPGHPRLRAVLALTVVGQLLLHTLYGPETFTYACHFAPPLVVVAALATLTRARRVALLLAAVLIVCAAINNASQFRRAREFVEHRSLLGLQPTDLPALTNR